MELFEAKFKRWGGPFPKIAGVTARKPHRRKKRLKKEPPSPFLKESRSEGREAASGRSRKRVRAKKGAVISTQKGAVQSEKDHKGRRPKSEPSKGGIVQLLNNRVRNIGGGEVSQPQKYNSQKTASSRKETLRGGTPTL